MQMKRKILDCKILILLILIVIFLSGCETNRYKHAHSLYVAKNYAGAIGVLDDYIKTAKNGAFITRAEMDRSDSYYNLGKLSVEKKNWKLAIRLLILANSEQADHLLDKCYYQLAENAFQANDITTGLLYYDLIVNEIPTSELVPDILLRKIRIALDTYHDIRKAWQVYMILYNRFPDSPTEIEARPLISSFISQDVAEAVEIGKRQEYEKALATLFEIKKYPVGDKIRIENEIANIYMAKADTDMKSLNYHDAVLNLKLAVQYSAEKKETADQKLRSIAGVYIEKGNSEAKKRNFDTAIDYYEDSFQIIPEYPLAIKLIQDAKTTRHNIDYAVTLVKEGEQLETNRKFKDALANYQKAHELDHLDEYSRRIFLVSNIIEAEKNPETFTYRIITEYKGGKLNREIAAKRKALLLTNKADDVKDSGWKIMHSPGQYKYEARYDLYTLDQSFFYVFQVNLKERIIVPLNKLSENLMQ
jgi:tetratricopeptide (TPR) repeat protein